jgi:hypothetical protein
MMVSSPFRGVVSRAAEMPSRMGSLQKATYREEGSNTLFATYPRATASSRRNFLSATIAVVCE